MIDQGFPVSLGGDARYLPARMELTTSGKIKLAVTGVLVVLLLIFIGVNFKEVEVNLLVAQLRVLGIRPAPVATLWFAILNPAGLALFLKLYPTAPTF